MANTISRRAFLAATAGAAVPLNAAGSPPNVVLIYADDLGYGDLACYGSARNRTPNIDRMAAEGVRFTDCYVPTPYCAPSRASLLTGRYPFRHQLMTNPAPDAGVNEVGLPASEITLAEALKPLGYTSTCVGKWHLGHTEKYLPRTQGFDESYGILYSNDMRPVQLVENERVAEYPVVQSKLTGEYTRRATDFIERSRKRPFFLYLPHAMPHKPLAASEKYYTPETKDDLYADVIRELDWSVGEVIDKLRSLDLESNTLVIFASDNGPWYGGSTAGLRGMKSTTWEGGLRVPLIAHWPGRIPASLVSHEICGVIDIFPTVCQLAGVELRSDRIYDGRDIWPLMTQKDARTPHEAIYGGRGAMLSIVRSGKWKLHVRPPEARARIRDEGWVDPRGPDGVTLIAPYEQARPGQYPGADAGDTPKPMMLFDLETDRAETRDVSAAHPEIVARLKRMFDEMEKNVPKQPAGATGRRELLRLTGGELRYDKLPEAAAK
jgi:uncharacterized sulfatase